MPKRNARFLVEPLTDYRETAEWQALQEHRCATCRDSGRVRRVTDLHDPAFGKTFPCPADHRVCVVFDGHSYRADRGLAR